ncbi:MAG: hypothetical protein K2J40_09220 [Ruminococcus sp.]|nr:hypothetical protein [Ruminococcus sp.]
MLTEINSDGTWSCHGVDLNEVKGNLYGALCKLRDYEKSGFEPDDLDRVKENIHIGSYINGYVVFGVWNDYCIAENLNSPDNYVVWKIDGFGVWAGHYFDNKKAAEEKFFESAFGAVSNKTEYWKR